MSAQGRMPRRRSSRGAYGMLGVLAGLGVWVAVATGASTSVVAGPPSSHEGPWVEVRPTSGVAADPFTASYWFVGFGPCQYESVRYEWDGLTVGTSDVDRTTCTAKHRFQDAPTQTLGDHEVTATACYTDLGSGGLHCAWAATTYTVVPATTPQPTPRPTAKPTAVPTAVPTAKPTAVPTAKPTAAPTPRPTPAPRTVPTPAPTAEPPAAPTAKPSEAAVSTPVAVPSPDASGQPPESAAPSPDPSPSTIPPSDVPSSSDGPGPDASPTGGVAAETSPPDASASPGAGAAGSGDGPPGNSYVPAIVSYIGGPEAGAIDPAVVGTNLLLTTFVVFLFMLTSEVFNSTMDANRAEVHGWWGRLLRGPLAIMGALTFTGAGLSRLSGASRLGSVMRVLAILMLLGLIYGFLSPDFGLNPQSIILFVSLVIGLGFLTYFSEGSSTRLATRRYRANASIRLYGTAVVVAIVAVIISRSVDFQPGLLYGFIASAVIIAPVALAKRDDATLVLVPAFGLMLVSVLAWLLLGPVRTLAADGAPAPALIETILGMIVIGGIEGLFVTMIPLTFLDGATVMRWSRIAWVVVFGTITFLWWQLLLNQDAAYSAALEQTNVQVVAITLGAFMLTTGLLWSYFRFRPRPVEADA